jgi:hypothetical protein
MPSHNPCAFIAIRTTPCKQGKAQGTILWLISQRDVVQANAISGSDRMAQKQLDKARQKTEKDAREVKIEWSQADPFSSSDAQG